MVGIGVVFLRSGGRRVCSVLLRDDVEFFGLVYDIGSRWGCCVEQSRVWARLHGNIQCGECVARRTCSTCSDRGAEFAAVTSA